MTDDSQRQTAAAAHADIRQGEGVMRDELNVGDLAYDTRKGALGVVMDMDAAAEPVRFSLRPPGGGVEWDVHGAHVRRATVADQLRPALAEVNARSREGTTWG
ncbi:hypothetical protein ACFWIA_24710 [Streptomyces sp. NPDC127068]|uniref:hypothetical protein n=1 Tax=Streptomyces sp. NPDC127068 TaxID=3347127 RepID=UPI003648C336